MKNIFSACFFQIEELFVYVKMCVSSRFRVNDRFMSKKLAIYVKVWILLEFSSWSNQEKELETNKNKNCHDFLSELSNIFDDQNYYNSSMI
jgi:hypothetical protein